MPFLAVGLKIDVLRREPDDSLLSDSDSRLMMPLENINRTSSLPFPAIYGGKRWRNILRALNTREAKAGIRWILMCFIFYKIKMHKSNNMLYGRASKLFQETLKTHYSSLPVIFEFILQSSRLHPQVRTSY
jgi:hypothetical protein